MPAFRYGALLVVDQRVGEICTTRTTEPPCYVLPPDLPPGVRVRLLAYTVGSWLVEREDDPGGRRWEVYRILLEPDPVPGFTAMLDRERRNACP